MQRWAMGIRRLGMTLGCLVVLTGCAFQRMHYKSLPQLRDETAINYSQQVLDTIVNTCDEARLPVFFRLENGTSYWAPTYSGTAIANAGANGGGATGVIGSVTAGEGLQNQHLLQSFGAAAMSRVTSLYNLLCFNIRYGNTVLPNGTLYTAVETADSREHFLIGAKKRNGQYVGVTPARSKEFLLFAQDVTYWSQTAEPALRDLVSTTGKLYRFAVEYDMSAAHLVQARLARFATEEAMVKAQEALKAKQQAFDALAAEAKTSTANPLILQTLLQLASQELQTYKQNTAHVGAEFGKLDNEILIHANTLIELEALLEDILIALKTHDPSLATLDTPAIIAFYRQNFETFRRGDRQQLEALPELTMPPVAGHKARDSADQLYRERFQTLPPIFDPRRQGTQ